MNNDNNPFRKRMNPQLTQETSTELTSKKKKDRTNVITTLYSNLKGLIPQGIEKEEFYEIMDGVKAMCITQPPFDKNQMKNLQQNKHQYENLNFNKKREQMQRKEPRSILEKNHLEEPNEPISYLEMKLNEINASDPYSNYDIMEHKSKQMQRKENQNQNQFNSNYKCNDFQARSIHDSNLEKNKKEINSLEPYFACDNQSHYIDDKASAQVHLEKMKQNETIQILDDKALTHFQNHSCKQNEIIFTFKNFDEKIMVPKENELNEALFAPKIPDEKNELKAYLFHQGNTLIEINESYSDYNKNNKITVGANPTIIKIPKLNDEQNQEKSFDCEAIEMNTKNNHHLIQENQKKTADKRTNEHLKFELNTKPIIDNNKNKIDITKKSEHLCMNDLKNWQNQEKNEKKPKLLKKEPRVIQLKKLNTEIRASERIGFEIFRDEKIKKREEIKKEQEEYLNKAIAKAEKDCSHLFVLKSTPLPKFYATMTKAKAIPKPKISETKEAFLLKKKPAFK